MLCGKNISKAALVIGGVSEKTQIQHLRAGSGLIIATPGRLQDFIDRKLVDLRQIKMLVLDEADRMLDMGFLPAIRRVLRSLPEDRQTLVLLSDHGAVGGQPGTRLHAESRASGAGLGAQAGGKRTTSRL